MSADPHSQLLLQIRGVLAEYERRLIAERMCRGRQAKLRAGTLLPWTTAPFGYRLDAERPRRADAVRTTPRRRRWSPSCSTGTSNPRQPSTGWPAADRPGGAGPDGRAALEHSQRARHLA